MAIHKIRERIPADWPVQPLRTQADFERVGGNWTQCGTCSLHWDDRISTSMTPAPAGRCPFEYFHTD